MGIGRHSKNRTGVQNGALRAENQILPKKEPMRAYLIHAADCDPVVVAAESVAHAIEKVELIADIVIE